ncbi:MAG: CocE/NonD family hydrolase [Burkholderiales bacterium]|nr:MAG: CocE/NonD family hydrolase [Burkholderiales bacterium]
MHPTITITEPPAGIQVDWNAAVPMRDGTLLRANVFRPEGNARYPVLLCAHPYGKDDLPLHRKTRDGYRVSPQYHLMRCAPLTHSAWTSWESPDPAHWAPRGYVVINADLRGFGTSDGVPSAFSAQEGQDLYDLIEWAAEQPWSSGRVGMLGVSYLALTQWRAAALKPPHLAAICPWEGFTDLYRDFARPGGIRETGFLNVWGITTKRRTRGRVDLHGEVRRRPLRDDWYAACDVDLEAIDVPALVCGSFSDHNLHSRGSFEGFRRIASSQKWLYTHRSPKWQAFYSPEALAAQQRFFDHFLKDIDNGQDRQPRVRLEIREDCSTVAEVRHADDWPLPQTEWRTWHGHASSDISQGQLLDPPATASRTLCLQARGGPISFTHRFESDVDIVGPMILTLTVSLEGGDDFPLIAGVRKFRAGREVTFEGSFGFQGDLVTHGMLLTSHAAEDPARSTPWQPVHSHVDVRTLAQGERVTLRIGMLPSATRFRAGDELRLDIQGHWFQRRNPVTGQFPVGYSTASKGTCLIHLEPHAGLRLCVPTLPPMAASAAPN